MQRTEQGYWRYSGYVRTGDDDTIEVAMPPLVNVVTLVQISMSRRDARLLARRLHECLDATSKTHKSRKRHLKGKEPK